MKTTIKNKMKDFKKQKSYYSQKDPKSKGFLLGILYGLAPHVFCILFIVFATLGTTTATTFLKPSLLNPYFFIF